MKIQITVDNIPPEKVGKIMDQMREALAETMDWTSGIEYRIGAVDDNCKPAAGEC